MASSISETAAAGFSKLTGTDAASVKRVYDLNNRNGNPSYNAQLGTVIKDLAESLTALDVAVDATVGIPSAWAAPVATIVALQAVASASRADKQARVVENNGNGGRSVYVFDAEETAAGDGLAVVTPTDVVEPAAGRWVLAHQDTVMAIPVVNKTGGALAKGKVVYLSGWDGTAGRHTVALADSTDRTKQATGVLIAQIANDANGVVMVGNVSLTSSGLNTGASSIGAPVYYTSAGALTLTAPSSATPYDHVVARVVTLAASGTLRIGVETPRPVGVATTSVAGLQSAADKTKQNNTVAYMSAQFTAAECITGTFQRTVGLVHKAGTLSDVSWQFEGLPTQVPLVSPADDIVVELRSGTTVLASKTYAAGGTALPAPYTWGALTLSAVPADLALTPGTSLDLVISQNGASNIAKAGSAQVSIVPA